jgi:hypothetical protein
MYSLPDYFEAWNASIAKLNILTITTAGCRWSDFDGKFRTKPLQPKLEPPRILYNYDCSYPTWNPTSRLGNVRWNVVSASCILYPCVKELMARVENGQFNEAVVKETPIYPYAPFFNHDTPICPVLQSRHDDQYAMFHRRHTIRQSKLLSCAEFWGF